MARRRALRGVLDNTLASLASRSSDHEGYWAMGFFAREPEPVTLDLTAALPAADASLQGTFARRAATVLQAQVRKAGLPPSVVREATLTVAPDPAAPRRFRNGRDTTRLILRGRVTTDLGGTVAREREVWAAPHDPAREWRSLRPDRQGPEPA